LEARIPIWIASRRWHERVSKRDPIPQLTYRCVPGAGIGYEFCNDAGRLCEVAVSAVAVR
jgi:hypothetical protein